MAFHDLGREPFPLISLNLDRHFAHYACLRLQRR
jgi:hypothetical protein